MSPEEACPFCRIASGEEPAEVVCETATWVAFFPDTPATPGHTLVIPRRHVADFVALDTELGASLMQGLVRVARGIGIALKPRGMNLISSSGAAAEQTVYHLHFHVVPRNDGDRIGKIWPPDKAMAEATKEGLAELIRDACASIEP